MWSCAQLEQSGRYWSLLCWPCLAVIRTCQPGASWPRFTVLWLWLHSLTRHLQPQHLQNSTALNSTHNSSQRIFLVLIILRTEIRALLYLLRTVCLSSLQHCFVNPCFVLYATVHRGVRIVWWADRKLWPGFYWSLRFRQLYLEDLSEIEEQLDRLILAGYLAHKHARHEHSCRNAI